MSHVALEDELLDAQLLRAIGQAPYGGADIGECLAAASRIHGDDLDSWYDAWADLAASTRALAEAADGEGRRDTARLAWLRTSAYERTAGCMLIAAPLDQRLVDSNTRQTEAFRRAGALMDPAPEWLRIPYEDTTLPGWFLRAGGDGDGPRPTVILVGGYDGTAEELYFASGAAAHARGYHVLAFDGPGQGGALIQQGLTLRADFEHVVGPVVDFAVARPEVDAERIALIGWSLGGHLAPRAASAEHRLAACIADCGAFDMYQGFLDRLPEALRTAYQAGDEAATATIAQMLDGMAAQPTRGWSLRRGMLVHGVQTPLAYVEAMRDFSLAGRAERITCPTLVCQAEGDAISASAPQLVAALTCPHEHILFTAAEGAGDHCEAGARLLFHARAFGWLDALLKP
jgi:pimeloyl-ACP methyl ester carboxylesterase